VLDYGFTLQQHTSQAISVLSNARSGFLSLSMMLCWGGPPQRQPSL